MTKYYEAYWDEKTLDTTVHVLWKKDILSRISVEGSMLLDIGCGNGFISEQFLDRFVVHGLDVSENALSLAKKKGIVTQKIDENLTELPFESGSFDVVICLDVLEHLKDPEQMTREIHRVLKKDGRYIVCVPNMLNLYNRLHFLCGEFVDIMDVAHRNNELFSEHIKVFSRKKLSQLLEKCGFVIKKRYHYFPDRLTEKIWMRYLCHLVYKLRLHDRFPSLFALGFLYMCGKKM